ncbi:hypothetical protein E2C01_056275 [Portunus trituberculatus]|uniref:Uncharacterized protein n=1 Tax=Portunus trituberculatus TaxID=210409 RepID=A0A5B7GTN4_PORTR|nr:hypothetical protein [Portunus trituberculatus]
MVSHCQWQRTCQAIHPPCLATHWEVATILKLLLFVDLLFISPSVHGMPDYSDRVRSQEFCIGWQDNDLPAPPLACTDLRSQEV